MAGRARPRLRVIHRRVLVGVARDVTEATARRSALVLAPHPDDETIACGATIARKVATGATVRVVVATDGGDELRRVECLEACRRLGLQDHDVTFLGLPDGNLAAHADALDTALRSMLDTFVPEEVFAPSVIDAHPDHRSLAASVDRLRADVLGKTQVLAYPVWFWNRWAWVDRATPRWLQTAQLAWRPLKYALSVRTRVVRVAPFADLKAHALAAHRSQIDESFADPGQNVLDPDWLAMFMGTEELFFVVHRAAF